MVEYLVETYQPRLDADERAALVVRIEEAVSTVEADDVWLRYLGPIFVADDEICLHRFDASSEGAVVEASRRAGLAHVRIVEAVE